MAACRGTQAPAEAPAEEPAAEAEAEGEADAEVQNYKIGIITGTATQGDEEITQATKMKEKYGDMIVTST